jgi:hypothetical protein
MNADLVNTYAAKWTITGWFVGLIYYQWFGMPAHLPLWEFGLLAIVGMFAASILIGGLIAFLLGLMTKAITGGWEDPTFHAWGVFISPILAFFAAKYAVRILA